MIYDLIILGAGIHGAACAQAAAAQGYSVLVLEKKPQPGLATSSKSSKLIHGGLRYLESGQFRLVRECLNERRYLLRNAPALVKLVPFHIPIYRSTHRRPWLIHLGLIIYSLFSGTSFRRLYRHNWGPLDGLNQQQLQTVFRYFDAQTDDQRLTQAVMASAESLGATCLTQAEFIHADCTAEICQLQYRQHSETHTVSGRLLINATGPWANEVLQHISPSPVPLSMQQVLGSHILVPRTLQQGMYYLEAPQDQRAVFIMPWGEQTLIGTTETPFNGSPDHIDVPETDIDYLLAVYNHYFEHRLTRADVINAFAGLRVLPSSPGRAFSRPRDTIIHQHEGAAGVFTLYGGKLTAHRATAEQLMARIHPLLPSRNAIADTRYLKLPV